MPDDKPIPYRVVRRLEEDGAAERAAVVAALLATPASISPKYFYDELGCALYGAICRLPEYYPTRTEVAIFRDNREEIAQAVGTGTQFVDLGAGDCCKALAWLPFLSPSRYIAVDIAAAEIERALSRMAPDFPEIEMIGVVADFLSGLPVDDVLDGRPATFFYPGSSIGNFSPEEACRFLTAIREQCVRRPGSRLLIGVDSKKRKRLLDAAYDDGLGVTGAFNRNVLLHLNARFGFDFDHGAFRHIGFYNEVEGRIEMHLEAIQEQTVRLGDRTRRFAAGERVHTENSYKYRRDEFESILRAAGFTAIRHWTNADSRYFVFLAE